MTIVLVRKYFYRLNHIYSQYTTLIVRIKYFLYLRIFVRIIQIMRIVNKYFEFSPMLCQGIEEDSV